MKSDHNILAFDSIYPYKILQNNAVDHGLHWHNYIELFYVKKGTLRLTTGDFSFHLDEGHICFINSGTIHSINQMNMDSKVIVLQVSTEKDSPFHSLKNYKFNFSTYLSDLSSATLPLNQLQYMIDQIYEESLINMVGFENVILGYINTMFGLLKRNYYLIPKDANDYNKEDNLTRLSTIIEYIDAHYSERITLKKLADDLHMNYYYLSHFFKDTAGISFQDYLSNLRVGKSLALLSDHNNTITHVSYASGFPNVKAYSKAFKSKFSVLPSEYRKTVMSNDLSRPEAETTLNISDSPIPHEPNKQAKDGIENFTKLSERLRLRHSNKHAISQAINITNASPIFELPDSAPMILTSDILSYYDQQELTDIIEKMTCKSVDLFISDSATYTEPYTIQKLSEYNIPLSSLYHQTFTPTLLYQDYDVFSLVSGIDLIQTFLSDPAQRPPLEFYLLHNSNFVSPFILSSSLLTSFQVRTPLYYAHQYIQQLTGTVIHASENCIVAKDDKTYKILCCHSKSLSSYYSMRHEHTFKMDDYLFFVQSFPELKLSISINEIKTHVQQNTYLVDNNNGCILNNWVELGSPQTLTSEYKDYLAHITQPKFMVNNLPFRESPIITIQLPALGFAYTEINLL